MIAPVPDPRPSVLIVDDESAILDTLRILLKNEGFQTHVALGGKQGIEQLQDVKPDIVLTDVRMPNVGGLEVLSAARQRDPDLPVILMTAQATFSSAIQAVNEGAFYYIQKPFANDDLIAILRRAAEHRQLRVENKSLKQEIKRRGLDSSSRPIGRSKSWLDVLRLAETVAPTESTVLIQGESGTGKEVVARYIHELSGRADAPFLSINCGALPESLLESELFGHVKGSFTGAVKDKAGLFTAAAGGTFFLDEIGETTPATQVKLLRAASAARGHSRRRDRGGPDRRARDRRDQSRARGGDEARRLPERSLLSPERLRAAPAAAPPSQGRHSAAGDGVPRADGKRAAGAAEAPQRGGARDHARVRVARQRARAGERARARGHPDDRRRDRRDHAPRARHRAAIGAAGRRARSDESRRSR